MELKLAEGKATKVWTCTIPGEHVDITAPLISHSALAHIHTCMQNRYFTYVNL